MRDSFLEGVEHFPSGGKPFPSILNRESKSGTRAHGRGVAERGSEGFVQLLLVSSVSSLGLG